MKTSSSSYRAYPAHSKNYDQGLRRGERWHLITIKENAVKESLICCMKTLGKMQITKDNYFSRKLICWLFSKPAKNSSIFGFVGIVLCVFLALRFSTLEHDGLVVDPGVAMFSESLIKVQGVLSRVLQQLTCAKFQTHQQIRNPKTKPYQINFNVKSTKTRANSCKKLKDTALKTSRKLHKGKHKGHLHLINGI